jgi:hypothetical protein
MNKLSARSSLWAGRFADLITWFRHRRSIPREEAEGKALIIAAAKKRWAEWRKSNAAA